jgi:hypothetical protein
MNCWNRTQFKGQEKLHRKLYRLQESRNCNEGMFTRERRRELKQFRKSVINDYKYGAQSKIAENKIKKEDAGPGGKNAICTEYKTVPSGKKSKIRRL